MAATIADIAGAQAPSGCRGRTLLTGADGHHEPVREFAYSRIQSYAALRDTRYRFTLEMNSGVPCELFDLKDDPNERHNLVNDPARASLVSDMKAALIDMQQA